MKPTEKRRYTLSDSDDSGWCIVMDNGQPTKARAKFGVSFSDKCEIHGGEFHGGDFYDGWLPLQVQGSMHFLNIPDGKTIRIGCEAHSPDVWLERWAQIGAKNGYTSEQCEEYLGYIKLAADAIKRAQHETD